MVISRFYDVFTTYKYIPDLKGETNLMVSVFNFGWTGILTIQILALCLLTYTAYIYCFKTIETIKVDEKNTLREFISIFHFNNPNDFFKLFYKLPSNKHSLVYSIGAIVPKALIIISLTVGTSTTMLIFNDSYRKMYREFKIPTFLYLTMIAIIVFLTVDFYKRERKKRIKNTAANNGYKQAGR